MRIINLEVCADSISSALAGENGGATRVEFCQNLSEGGTTPSLVQIQLCKKLVDLRLYVLSRPRGGDCVYSDLEFCIMKEEIKMCGEAHCDGVVIGILNADGSVDTERCRELVGLAKIYNMGVTFHRAFDRTRDLSQALEDVISLGCERILTSGGRVSAIEGAEEIKQLVQQAGGRISIMPGAGINEKNIAGLIKKTGAKEFHGTFRRQQIGNAIYHNPYFEHIDGENTVYLTDSAIVREAIEAANEVFI
jgi:copper homeostasis protein